MPEPRPLFVDGLYALDATDTRRRLALALAAVKAASIAAGGDGALLGTLHRVEAGLLQTARRGVEDLAKALAAHEAELARRAAAPVDSPVPAEAPRPGLRLPRLPPRPNPRT